MDDQCHQKRAEHVGQSGEKKASGKMLQGVAKIELEPAFEQHENDGQRSQQIGGFRQRARLHQAQHRTQQNSQHHQHQDVGDPGQAKDAVGQKGHHQQAADQSQN